MIEPLRAANLSSLPGVSHGFFTREGGVSEGAYASLNAGLATGDDPAKVAQNRARLAEALGGAPAMLLTATQVHGTQTVTVEAPWAEGQAPDADALVTRGRGVALGILTADCVPVLFADAQAGVVGAAHAGWKGALAGVLESAVAAMETLGATRAGIQAAIGPCIWQDSYEVDQAFMDRFIEEDSQNNRFFFESETAEHFLFELPGYVRSKLQRMELGGLSLSPADTCADEARFFSYRRSSLRGESVSGRQLSAIALIG